MHPVRTAAAGGPRDAAPPGTRTSGTRVSEVPMSGTRISEMRMSEMRMMPGMRMRPGSGSGNGFAVEGRNERRMT